MNSIHETNFDEINDAVLLATAIKRMDSFDPSLLITQKQLDTEFGFTESDYINTDDIEFE